ncbi:protein TolR [Endozoicomonadaceae bacterium StTr2]
MARVSRGRKPMSEINMVPFIDIMMVMLVAFMVSAPMLTQGVKVDLPKTTSAPITNQPKDILVVSVKADGSYYLNMGRQQDKAQKLAEVAEKVGKVVASNSDIPVLIKGDAKVEYGDVVRLMGHLQQAGVSNVGLVTDPEELK